MNDAGPWIVEIAGRSIGGLCSTVLRFGAAVSRRRHSPRSRTASAGRRARAPPAAMMMIPIPAARC
ncbi:MAG: hypothetical protein WKH64_15470 [Chloroflexia bacterium]